MRFCFAAVIVLVPFSVMAQGAKVPVKDVLARLVVDFDQDGVNDLLVFTSDNDGGPFATLHVFKGEKDAATGKEQLRLLSRKAEFGYGVYDVAEPRKGIITVESGNAQGRYKWDQKLTLAWRSGRLVVLGITYSSHDSVADDAAASACDLNLSTGKGTGKRNRPVTFSLKPVPVAEWTDEKRPAVCE